ncbi:MAG TPA: MGMT family protein [Candidatus Paceibacterota bacterium]
MKSNFSQKVYEVVRKIPRGKTLTYKQVARIAGKPKASRAVGNIISKNTNKNVPCHRVIRSDGKLGGYNGLRGKSKMQLLAKEGIKL